jgi:hypothetical protein
VEDGNETDLAAQMPGIPGEGLEGFAGRPEEQIVEGPGSGERQRLELVGQREDDMEVRHGQEIGEPRLEPVVLGQALALGTVAVATRVIDRPAVAAAGARLEVTAPRRGAAGRERAQDGALERTHRLRGAVRGPVARRISPSSGGRSRPAGAGDSDGRHTADQPGRKARGSGTMRAASRTGSRQCR